MGEPTTEAECYREGMGQANQHLESAEHALSLVRRAFVERFAPELAQGDPVATKMLVDLCHADREVADAGRALHEGKCKWWNHESARPVREPRPSPSDP